MQIDPDPLPAGLLAMRRRHGRNSPIGNQITVLLVQLENYPTAEDWRQKEIAKRMRDAVGKLADLTADENSRMVRRGGE